MEFPIYLSFLVRLINQEGNFPSVSISRWNSGRSYCRRESETTVSCFGPSSQLAPTPSQTYDLGVGSLHFSK
jgi:hypothetical protein